MNESLPPTLEPKNESADGWASPSRPGRLRGLLLDLVVDIAALVAFCSVFGQPVFGQNDPQIKVLGRPNPFMVTSPEIDLGSGIRGRIWSQGIGSGECDVVIKAVVERVDGALVEAQIVVDEVKPGVYSPFRAKFQPNPQPGVWTSVRFEALSYGGCERKRVAEAARNAKARAAETARIAALKDSCQKLRALVANKTVGSLTVSEADSRENCKKLGLW